MKFSFDKDAFRKIAVEAIYEETFSIECPHCGATVTVPTGKSKCPQCGNTIDLKLDIDFNS